MTNETNKQLSETKQALSETKQLRGTFDQVIRQINSEYHETNGWAVVRSANTLVSFTVWVERSVKQAPPKMETLQVNTSETPEKDVVEEVKVESAPNTAVKRSTTKKQSSSEDTTHKDVQLLGETICFYKHQV